VITKPVVPSTVVRFRGEQTQRIAPSFADIVAVPLTHDWGPIGSESPGVSGIDGGPQLVNDFQEWGLVFGDSDTPGRTAVAGAFNGQGLVGNLGAGGVYVYRLATSSAAVASSTAQNTTPGAALRFDGRYKGTRGNLYAWEIDDDPVVVGNDRLRIRFRGAVVETYSYPETDIAGLAAAVNAASPNVRLTSLITGVALAHTTGTLAGGNDGTTLTSTQWLDALSALEFKPFGILAPFDLTDGSIQASILSWVQAQDDANRAVTLVVAGESISTAITRSTALADPHVVNFGVGTYHDDLLDKDLSTSQLAPRIAGILAAKGEEHSLTASVIGGLHVVGNTGPASDAVKAAVQQGVTVVERVADPDGELAIAAGVTTFTNRADPDRPYDVFSDPRLVRIMDIFARTLKQWADKNIRGNTTVNTATRNAVRAQALRQIDDLLSRGLIITKVDGAEINPFVQVDPPSDPTMLDAIPFTFGWQFSRTTNYVLAEGRVR
jgi:hypothetical protein